VNGEIKYRFALDNIGNTADIRSLQNKANIAGRTFHCIACNEPMVAKLGTDVAHHFAHKPNSVCSGETYLHKLAKKVFQEEYERCLAERATFKIELEQRKICNHYPGFSETICSTKPRPQLHDLIPHYRTLRVEVEKDEFKPDIALESKNGKNDIWIEIVVTHKSSRAKLKSGKRIVEIAVQSEEDLLTIREHLLSFQDKRITFHNFKKDVPKNMCSWPSSSRYCRLGKKVFRLFKNGRYEVRFFDKNDDRVDESEDIVWSKEFFVDSRFQPISQADAEYELDATIKECVWYAQESGFVIKSCQFCEHYDFFGEKECRKFNERVPSRAAVDCESFSMVDDYDDLMGRCSDSF
jgi:hypothetical protein